GAVDGDAVAAPGAGIAQHPADLVHKDRIFKESLGSPAGAVGIARQKHGFGDVAGPGADVKAHSSLLLPAVLPAAGPEAASKRPRGTDARGWMPGPRSGGGGKRAQIRPVGAEAGLFGAVQPAAGQQFGA